MIFFSFIGYHAVYGPRYKQTANTSGFMPPGSPGPVGPIYSPGELYGATHEIFVLVPYAQKSPLNTPADVSNRALGINCALCQHLHPYIVYASHKVS